MCFEDIMKFEDIDSNNILSDKKSYENIWHMKVHAKPWLKQKLCVLGLIK